MSENELSAALAEALQSLAHTTAELEARLAELSECKKALARMQKLDAEAASYVESVIVMRTNFTGDPPHVGWKGLGLALKEALDHRDKLVIENRHLRAVLNVSGSQPPVSGPQDAIGGEG